MCSFARPSRATGNHVTVRIATVCQIRRVRCRALSTRRSRPPSPIRNSSSAPSLDISSPRCSEAKCKPGKGLWMSESRPMDRDVARSRWRWVWGAMACVGLAGLGYLLWSAYDHQAVMAWLGELRPLPFFLAMALLPAIGVPITPFFILAGATFGARGGLVGSWIALGLNLTVCYWIARKMRPRFESILRRFGYELPDFRERDKGSVRLTLGI